VSNKNLGGMSPPKTRREMEHNLALVFEDTLNKLKSNDEN
jgi:hypothetical protein